VMNGSDWQVSK